MHIKHRIAILLRLINTAVHQLSGISAVALIFVVSITAFAEQLPEQQVRGAVETWVRHITANARPDAVIERLEPYVKDGETVAYIAHLENGGFCLCGADDLVLPVYFYCPQGTYNADNPGLKVFLYEIYSRTEYMRQGIEQHDPDILAYQDVFDERRVYWQTLAAGELLPKKLARSIQSAPDSMLLNFTSIWGQNSPFNEQCPLLNPEHVVVGCDATAMVQTMYYWKWPPEGAGNSQAVSYDWRSTSVWIQEPLANDPDLMSSKYWSSNFFGRLTWNAGWLKMNGNWDETLYEHAQLLSGDEYYENALADLWARLDQHSSNYSAYFNTYDWNLMVDNYADPLNPTTPAQDAAVAHLCYDAGVGCGMNYGLLGSNSTLWDPVGDDVGDALIDHFLYDSDVEHDGYPAGSINPDLIVEDIQYLRPVIFRGDGDDGAHAWVIYGYKYIDQAQEEWEFKMNFGWYGANDGWHVLDTIKTSEFTFDGHYAHLSRIAPEGVIRFAGDGDAGDGTPDDPYSGVAEALSEAPGGSTVILKAGSSGSTSSPTTRSNPMVILSADDL